MYIVRLNDGYRPVNVWKAAWRPVSHKRRNAFRNVIGSVLYAVSMLYAYVLMLFELLTCSCSFVIVCHCSLSLTLYQCQFLSNVNLKLAYYKSETVAIRPRSTLCKVRSSFVSSLSIISVRYFRLNVYLNCLQLTHLKLGIVSFLKE